jgi:5-methylcytosine-specific restriction endonuclease McrA
VARLPANSFETDRYPQEKQQTTPAIDPRDGGSNATGPLAASVAETQADRNSYGFRPRRRCAEAIDPCFKVYRWAKHRHANPTGRWIAERYFPHHKGESWRFTDPKTGKPLIRVQETVKAPRPLKIKGDANPLDKEWEGYFQRRDRQLSLQASSGFRATVLTRQNGSCPLCRQVIQYEEDLELHHRDGNHPNNRIGNRVLLHPNCHRQLHYAPENKTELARPERGVGHA